MTIIFPTKKKKKKSEYHTLNEVLHEPSTFVNTELKKSPRWKTENFVRVLDTLARVVLRLQPLARIAKLHIELNTFFL